MKKITLLLMVLMALTGCLEEGTDGCPSYLVFTFLHDNSPEEFDRVIGNDVHLMLYNNEVLRSIQIIPYEMIAHGKEYIIRKQFTGTVDVVAFASPVSEQEAEPLPEYTTWDKKSDAVLRMKSVVRSVEEYRSMGSIYLGVKTFRDEDITREVVCPVSLINCITKVSVSVYADTELQIDGLAEKPRIELSGSKSEMDMDFRPGGEDVMISAELQYNPTNTSFDSGILGVLPSGDDQYLTVDGYKGDTRLFVVRTELQARPGSVIHIEVYRKTVVIEVDGWRMYNAVVEWL